MTSMKLGLGLVTLLLAMLTASCSNGTPPPLPRATAPPSSYTPAPIAPAGTSRVVAYGTVSASGSVSVNGIDYDAARAVVMFDRLRGTLSALRVGDVVLVLGWVRPDSGTGVAEFVYARSAVKGPITSIDAADQTFVALGQRVRIDADTSFDAAVPRGALAGLVAGDVVQVAGFRRGDGEIAATRIAALPLGSREFSVAGIASGVDSVAGRFGIDGLVVDCRTSAIEGFASGAVANGDHVEVEGASVRANGELVARSVSLVKDVVANGTGYRVELAGFTSGCSPPAVGVCKLAGVEVVTTAATVYEGGNYNSFYWGEKAEVEGTVEGPGRVVASKIRFSRPGPLRIAARVDSVESGDTSFVTLGVTVVSDALTRLEDKSAIQRQPFGLAHLAAGDFVEVRGIELVESGELLATIIERHEPRAETQLQGYPRFTPNLWKTRQLDILGVTVNLTDATRYPTPYGGLLSEGTFMFDLELSSLLDVRGTEVADRAIVASEIRFADWVAK